MIARHALIFILILGAMLKASVTSARISSESGTGDVVGNGHVILDELMWGIDDPDIYLNSLEMERRNQRFDYILNNLGIDPFASGTGDVVGNGGGYLESYGSYFYQTLERHITSSLTQSIIPFSDIERKILGRILYHLPNMKADKLRFLSGEKAESLFFIPGMDVSPRLAKTGFSPAYPIYFNTKTIYERFQSSPKFLLSLIVHELGHQVGVTDHGLLDSLGAKVIQVTEFNKEEIKTTLERGQLVVTVHNHFHQAAPSDVFFHYRNEKIGVLKWNMDILRRVCAPDYIYSAVVSNLHWSQRITDLVSAAAMNARGWLDVECFDSHTGATILKNRNLEIRIDIDGDKIDTNMFITR